MRSEVGMSSDDKVLWLRGVFWGWLREEVKCPDWLADVDDMSPTIGEECCCALFRVILKGST